MSDAGFSRWPYWRRWFGQRSERAAARYLRKLGYRILARNAADLRGEIDIIALDGRTLVVVEVRSTSSTDLERAAVSVDHLKQTKLTHTTLRYLSRHHLLGKIAVRFDILAVSWPTTAKTPTFWHIPNAFECVGKFQFYT